MCLVSGQKVRLGGIDAHSPMDSAHIIIITHKGMYMYVITRAGGGGIKATYDQRARGLFPLSSK